MNKFKVSLQHLLNRKKSLMHIHLLKQKRLVPIFFRVSSCWSVRKIVFHQTVLIWNYFLDLSNGNTKLHHLDWKAWSCYCVSSCIPTATRRKRGRVSKSRARKCFHHWTEPINLFRCQCYVSTYFNMLTQSQTSDSFN